MGFNRNLLKGALLSLFLPINSIDAQEKKTLPDSLLPPLELEKVVVEAEKPLEFGLPERVVNLLSGEDPNQKNYYSSPEISAVAPGLPSAVIYKQLLLGTRPYLGDIMVTGMSTSNWGLTSNFQGIIVEQRDDHPNAIKQSQDLILDARARIPDGFQLEAEPFKMAGGIGYNGKFLRGATAIRHQGVPDIFPLPEEYEKEVEPFGNGWSDHFYVEFGKAEPNRSPRISLQFQGNNLDIDFSNATNYDVLRFNSRDHQRMFIFNTEIPILSSSTIRTTISNQSNKNWLELQNLNDESPEITSQRIDVSTQGVSLRHFFNNTTSPLEARIGANRLEVDKKDLWGGGRPYDINQFYGELSGSLGPRIIGRTNFRFDDIEYVNGLQHSFFGELEIQVSDWITLEGRRGSLRDGLLRDVLEDLLGEFKPGVEGEVQEHNYAEFGAKVRTFNNHEFGLTLTNLRQNRPIYGDVEIKGSAARTWYQYASNNVSLTVALSHRDFEMVREDSITGMKLKGSPPGTPSWEGKIMLALHREKYSVGAAGALSNGSVSPIDDENVSLGPKIYLNPWITAGTGLFRIRGTLFNALGLLPNFENTLAVFGDAENRNRVEAPSFGYVSLHVYLPPVT